MFNDVKVVGVNFVFLKVLPSFGYVLLEVLCEGGVAKVAYLEVDGGLGGYKLPHGFWHFLEGNQKYY